MADTLTKDKRSAVMAAVRSVGNLSTELRLLRIMRVYGIVGWRRKQSLPGKPDFVFRRQRLAVFVDGCFWHGCPKHCRIPSSAIPYWVKKIGRNRLRDKDVRRLLLDQGWNVHRIWEHSLRDPRRVASGLKSKIAALSKKPIVKKVATEGSKRAARRAGSESFRKSSARPRYA
jgi:DNA mismatch endonuclease (patch repair protein)